MLFVLGYDLYNEFDSFVCHVDITDEAAIVVTSKTMIGAIRKARKIILDNNPGFYPVFTSCHGFKALLGDIL